MNEETERLDREAIDRFNETMSRVLQTLTAQKTILEKIYGEVYKTRDLLATIEAGRSGGF